MFAYTYLCLCLSVYLSTYIPIYPYECMSLFIEISINVRVHLYVCICACMYACTYACMYQPRRHSRLIRCLGGLCIRGTVRGGSRSETSSPDVGDAFNGPKMWPTGRSREPVIFKWEFRCFDPPLIHARSGERVSTRKGK